MIPKWNKPQNPATVPLSTSRLLNSNGVKVRQIPKGKGECYSETPRQSQNSEASILKSVSSPTFTISQKSFSELTLRNQNGTMSTDPTRLAVIQKFKMSAPGGSDPKIEFFSFSILTEQILKIKRIPQLTMGTSPTKPGKGQIFAHSSLSKLYKYHYCPVRKSLKLSWLDN
ncbi:hypothetical protein J3R74_002737 [Puniceicoccus vermicola]